jgi:hypothetical protein
MTCNKDSRQHPGTTLAAALVYARTGQAVYRTKAIDLINAARLTVRSCGGDTVLALARQLGAYVLAADYVDYRDPAFVSWVAAVRTQEFPDTHGLWHQLRTTSRVTSNNWGTFALTSVIAADAFLGDDAALAVDWATFVDYGDLGTTKFVHTADYEAAWSCPVGYEINPASCADPVREGAAVEDASRPSGPSFPTIAGYPAEAAQGYVLQAELLAKQGFDAWNANGRQVCRNALWRGRLGNLNYSSADRYVTYMTNERCGLSQATAGAPFGRVFGFTDWLMP